MAIYKESVSWEDQFIGGFSPKTLGLGTIVQTYDDHGNLVKGRITKVVKDEVGNPWYKLDSLDKDARLPWDLVPGTRVKVIKESADTSKDLASKIRANQDTKAMTKRAIQVLKAKGGEYKDLAKEYKDTYGEDPLKESVYSFTISDDDEIINDETLRKLIRYLNSEAKMHEVKVSGSGSGEDPDFMYEISISGSPENIESFIRSYKYRRFMGFTSDADVEDEVKYMKKNLKENKKVVKEDFSGDPDVQEYTTNQAKVLDKLSYLLSTEYEAVKWYDEALPEIKASGLDPQATQKIIDGIKDIRKDEEDHIAHLEELEELVKSQVEKVIPDTMVTESKRKLRENNSDWETPEDAINDLIYRLAVLRRTVNEVKDQFESELDTDTLKRLNRFYTSLFDAQDILEELE